MAHLRETNAAFEFSPGKRIVRSHYRLPSPLQECGNSSHRLENWPRCTPSSLVTTTIKQEKQNGRNENSIERLGAHGENGGVPRRKVTPKCSKAGNVGRHRLPHAARPSSVWRSLPCRRLPNSPPGWVGTCGRSGAAVTNGPVPLA